jgi:hypothetical protein
MSTDDTTLQEMENIVGQFEADTEAFKNESARLLQELHADFAAVDAELAAALQDITQENYSSRSRCPPSGEFEIRLEIER